MTPYAAARAVVDAVDRALRSWAEDVLREAGAALPVRSSFRDTPPDERTLVLFPYRLAPWPKLAESADPVPILGGAHRRGSPNAAAPDVWLDVAAAATACLREVFPTHRTRSGALSVRPTMPVEALPKPLLAWYRAQPVLDPPWISEQEGRAVAHLPAMTWTPGLQVRLHYLVQVDEPEGGPPEGEGVGAALLGAITLGTHLRRVLEVPMPPAPLPPEQGELLRAVAASVPGTAGEQLAEVLDRALSTVPHRVPILPDETPASDDFAEIQRGLRRQVQPTVLLMLQLPLGGRPTLIPGVAPSIHTGGLGDPPGGPTGPGGGR